MGVDDLGTLRGKVTLETGQFTAGAAAATGGLSSIQRQAAATALGLVGAASLQQAISTVTNAVKGAVTEFAALQTALAEVSTLVDTSFVNMATLGSGVSELAVRYGQDAGGLAKALYQTISAGVDAGDAIGFLDTAVQAAIGGVTNTETAVNALTSVLNAFGMSSDRAGEASDSLFVTVKRGKTTMAELSSAVGQVAPIANAVGLSLDEMNSALATLTLSGMSTSESATALRGVMNALLRPTQDSMKMAKALGIEFTSAAVKSKGFAAVLEELRQKTGGSEEALALLVPDVRGLSAALQLTGTGAETFTDILGDMEGKLGATEGAASKMKDTLSYEWGIAVQNIKNVSLEIMESLEPAIMSSVRAFNKLLDLAKDEKAQRVLPLVMEAAGSALPIWRDIAKAVGFATDKLRDNTDAAEEHVEVIGEEVVSQEEAAEALKKKREEEERLAKAREIAAAKARKLRDKAKDDSKKDEQEAKRIAREAERRAEQLAAIEIDTARAASEAQLSLSRMVMEERVEHYKALASSAEASEMQQGWYAQMAAEAKAEYITKERDEKLAMLAVVEAAKKKEYENDIEMADAIAELYDQQRKAIMADWNQNVTRELSISVSAVIDLNINAFHEELKRVVREIGGSLGRLASSIIDVFASSGAQQMAAIVDMVEAGGNEIADLLGGDYGDIAGMFTDAFSVAWDALNAIEQHYTESEWEAIYRAERDAMRDLHLTVRKLRESATDWLKSIGLATLEDYSQNELSGLLEDTQGQWARSVSQATGVEMSYDELQQILSRGREDILERERLDSPLRNLVERINLTNREFYNLAMGSGGMESQEAIKDIEFAIQTYEPGYTPSAAAAGSFSQAEQAVRLEAREKGLGNDWVAAKLWEQAQRFSAELSPWEYANYRLDAEEAAADAGVEPLRAAGTSVSSAVSSVPDTQVSDSVSAAVQAASSATLLVDVTVHSDGEYTSAVEIGEQVGESINEYFTSQGI